MKSMSILRALFATAFLAGCFPAPVTEMPGDDDDDDDSGDPVTPPTTPPSTTGGEDTTYDHENDLDVDPWELLDRLNEEGPPEFSARLHSCPKMRYSTIGRVLTGLGVNMNGAAGQSFTDADQSLGVANFQARQPEASDLTTASAAKLFDIFAAAAPEIITAMPSVARCGTGTQMFDGASNCTAAGITCLTGLPANANHVDICNLMVTQATTVDRGRRIAVATILAAAHTCE